MMPGILNSDPTREYEVNIKATIEVEDHLIIAKNLKKKMPLK